ncbi:MAG: hydroxypyruvate isomerase family protein [Proteobacteria bacterium]|nr:hydroxypyruvate isomerase family protein [Pseudomonadota bacterium]MBI3497157.1 hydroxypyruvate isomerase family protein [Pseudomonadota bacterium]
MPRFAANLSMMYPELVFLDRFAAAARDGFKAVEILFPYAIPAETIRARLAESGLESVLINLPPGDLEQGERGLASLPGREADFDRALDTAISYAHVLGCRRLHVMAGIVPAGAERRLHRATYIDNLRHAAAKAAEHGITLLIEPINQRDVPGYFLNRQEEAHAIRAEVGSSNLKVQMDLYHCQIVEGDVATKIRRYIGEVAHMQIAGVPERHEPSIGEVNYPYLFRLIDELGYGGWVGCEYRPKADTSAGLDWMAPYL